MADSTKSLSELHTALAFRPWHGGDPAVLLEAILERVDQATQKQLVQLYLDSVASTLEANLKFVQGVRSAVGGAAARP